VSFDSGGGSSSPDHQSHPYLRSAPSLSVRVAPPACAQVRQRVCEAHHYMCARVSLHSHQRGSVSARRGKRSCSSVHDLFRCDMPSSVCSCQGGATAHASACLCRWHCAYTCTTNVWLLRQSWRPHTLPCSSGNKSPSNIHACMTWRLQHGILSLCECTNGETTVILRLLQKCSCI